MEASGRGGRRPRTNRPSCGCCGPRVCAFGRRHGELASSATGEPTSAPPTARRLSTGLPAARSLRAAAASSCRWCSQRRRRRRRLSSRFATVARTHLWPRPASPPWRLRGGELPTAVAAEWRRCATSSSDPTSAIPASDQRDESGLKHFSVGETTVFAASTLLRALAAARQLNRADASPSRPRARPAARRRSHVLPPPTRRDAPSPQRAPLLRTICPAPRRCPA